MMGAKAGVNATTRTPGGPGETVITGSAGPPSLGLFTAMADDITIDGFTFEGNSAGGGLATSESFSGYVVEDNVVTDNLTGLYSESNGHIPSVIRDNFFDRNNNGSGSGNGVFTFRPLANASFTGNKFLGNNSAPINIAGGESPEDKTRGGVLLFTGFAAVTNTGTTIADNIIDHTATVAGRWLRSPGRHSGRRGRIRPVAGATDPFGTGRHPGRAGSHGLRGPAA
jgi:hypothetical protein